MLDFVLLGMLRQPCSGYELKRRFARTVIHFWSADQSQIYRTLKRLEERNLIRSRSQPSPEGPDRVVYRRLAAGVRAFEEWLQGEPVVRDIRAPHVAQLYFLSHLDDLEATQNYLDQMEDRFEKRLQALRGLKVDASEHPDEGFHAQLSLDLGVSVAEARLAWCAKARRKIQRRKREQPGTS